MLRLKNIYKKRLESMKNNQCLQKTLLKKRFISVILKSKRNEYIITNVFQKGKRGLFYGDIK